MTSTWFIGDLHFFHKNILFFENEKRPFSCLEEMHEHIIKKWNENVKEKDKIYCLGDMIFDQKNINQ